MKRGVSIFLDDLARKRLRELQAYYGISLAAIVRIAISELYTRLFPTRVEEPLGESELD
jgi:hypothetical protein